MRKAILTWCLVLILALVTPGFAQTVDLQSTDLAALKLPENLVAGVSNVLPSKPGDTFVKLRNGMTVLIRENHASRVVSTQILVKAASTTWKSR